MRPVDIVRLDEILVTRYDEAVRAGVARAGSHVVCRIGCTACCIGVFDVTALDAARLRRGLAELAEENPSQSAAILERARSQSTDIATRFGTSTIPEDDGARDRFCEALEDLPCPVLDPDTGACLLYEFRPLTCRSYGLPVVFGSERLPPCPLNFERASDDDIERATIVPDPDDEEGRILDALNGGDTIIAAALGN